MLADEDVPHFQLVRRIGVGMQEADAHRVDPAVAEPPRHLDRTVLVERPQLVAPEVHPAGNRAYEVGWDDAIRLHPEVRVAVAVGHRLPGDLENELVTLVGDEAECVDLAFEQLVGRDGGAVADCGQCVSTQAEPVEDLSHAVHEPVGRVRRRRRGLRGDDLSSRLVHRDDVGERATGVDPEPDPPASLRHCGRLGAARTSDARRPRAQAR